MNEWIGLIGALSGTIIGGFVTYKVASQKNSFDIASENRRRLITVCESIHELLTKTAGQTNALNMGILGDLGYGKPLKSDVLSEQVQLDRLKMLVDFYTPSLSKEVIDITNEFSIVCRSVGEVILKTDRNNDWVSLTTESAALSTVKIVKLTQEAQSKLGEVVRAALSQG